LQHQVSCSFVLCAGRFQLSQAQSRAADVKHNLACKLHEASEYTVVCQQRVATKRPFLIVNEVHGGIPRISSRNLFSIAHIFVRRGLVYSNALTGSIISLGTTAAIFWLLAVLFIPLQT
jgi:hypothetical protein